MEVIIYKYELAIFPELLEELYDLYNQKYFIQFSMLRPIHIIFHQVKFSLILEYLKLDEYHSIILQNILVNQHN